jgi:hypothetical protein
MLHPEQHEEGACKADAQSENIDEGYFTFFEKDPDGLPQIAECHGA